MPPLIQWVFLLFGAWLAYLCITALLTKRKNYQQAQKAASWPSIPGRIVSMEVSEGRYRSSETQQMVYTYWPKVTYAYTVDGKELRGERLAFGKIMYYSSAEADAFQSAHAEGATVPVYYDPAASGESVLDRDPAHATKLVIADGFMLIAGLAMIIAGLWGMLG